MLIPLGMAGDVTDAHFQPFAGAQDLVLPPGAGVWPTSLPWTFTLPLADGFH